MVIEIDARGLGCPIPVVKTKKALDGIEDGDLTVLIERMEGCQNVQRFAESRGCQVSVEERDGLFYINIHKEKTTRPTTPMQNEAVVLITSDCIGTGERELGVMLMKGFLNTMREAEPKPAKLLFLNDGVRLTTQGSEVLESLKLLEESGVEIFSCGTCLEYYKLKDKLEVGLITNALETVESLFSAGKVIKL